jgi:hypothetical protein
MRILIFLFFILCSFAALSQPNIPPDPPSAEPVPLGGFGFLLLAGALLGISRIRKAIKDKF